MEVQNENIKQLTKEILQLKKSTVENMLKIGEKLLLVKKSLAHGEFGKYLEENVDMSTRNANRFMKVVSEFSNKTTLSNLEPSKLVILLDVPKNQIDDFAKENDLDNMSCREIREKIKKLKESSKKEKNNKKTKDEVDEQQETKEEKTYSENSTEDNQSNYDEDGSYNPFKNFKSKDDFKSFFEDFDFSQFKQNTLLLDMSPEEKKTLKKFYNILAKQVHPDKGGSQKDMQILNKLKEGWGI